MRRTPSNSGLTAGLRLTRRDMVGIGTLGLAGLTLPDLFSLQRASLAEGLNRPASTFGRAKSAILLFLSGGPSQLDMFDLKPEAPEEIRGTFAPIETKVPGISISEHLPKMAGLADKFAVVRSVQHRQPDHPAAAYWMMVGSPIGRPARDAGFMSRADRPHPGSVLAKLQGPRRGVPPFVMVPEAIQPNGPERSGQYAGFLGGAFDPYRINSDPNLADYSPGVVQLHAGISDQRLERRRELLDNLQDSRAQGVQLPNDADYERAFDLLSSSAVVRAFDIHAEPDTVRDRYGRHVFGQSVLLARRMVEAGVRLVHVNWVRHDGGKGGQGYDSHRNHLEWSKNELLPPTDAAFASLIEDLDSRGLLDETLVIMMGEFGRTPRFNKDGGRDHWPHCFSVVMAGGGVSGGRVHGASDKSGAYPVRDVVTPGDLIATLYHVLGIDPDQWVYDGQARPFKLVEGTPLASLLV